MAYSKFCDGAIISATSFVRDQAFDVEVLSSSPVADGATAKILLGRIAQTGQAQLGVSGTVALKLFVNNMADYQQQLLDRELRAIRRVQHPYILPYAGTAVFEFHKIIISPYMKNGNLLEYLATNVVDRGTLLYQVAEAVNFLHTDHKIIHGDLKCENVLVSDEGTALLADFGLSTFMERTEMSTRTATALRQLMTLQFAAPELVFGTEIADGVNTKRPARRTAKTDVYAFGMMIVQAYTGKPPWADCTIPEIMMKLHWRVIHPRPTRASGALDMPDSWWSVCLDCWLHEPYIRPSMKVVLDWLTVMQISGCDSSLGAKMLSKVQVFRTPGPKSMARRGGVVISQRFVRNRDSADEQVLDRKLRTFHEASHRPIPSYVSNPLFWSHKILLGSHQNCGTLLQYIKQHNSTFRRRRLVRI